ncbi:type IVB secretion system protein IcmM/DotJ [Legionella quinlivanii]|uniref:type IVB secretion system protein IcmM/DotJ n=1 Tax=Legionella quinlivanii TaxID=45073 RepID=UPI002243DA76|nr:type IVB secretion system protein IcmM/DotJ [Legionella quinlivanii]MCW8451275.1 type IVB secretion system protein IcmM/DotJ [Legionella quinlivanii]
MSRVAWNLIKESKSFYVTTYRRIGTWILIMLGINVLLFIAIAYSRFHQPQPDFYATNGITPPVVLTPMDTPNYSNEALLPPDPVNDDNEKPIPE